MVCTVVKDVELSFTEDVGFSVVDESTCDEVAIDVEDVSITVEVVVVATGVSVVFDRM